MMMNTNGENFRRSGGDSPQRVPIPDPFEFASSVQIETAQLLDAIANRPEYIGQARELRLSELWREATKFSLMMCSWGYKPGSSVSRCWTHSVTDWAISARRRQDDRNEPDAPTDRQED